MTTNDQYSYLAFVSELGSPKTKELRRRYISEHVAWLQTQGLTAASAETADIIRYIEYRTAGLAASTTHTIFSSLRAYYRWLEERGAIPRNPLARVRSTPGPRPTAQFVDPNHLRAMLDCARTPTHWLLISVLAFHSLRISEFLACDIEDLSRHGGKVALSWLPIGPGVKSTTTTTLVPEIAEKLDVHLGGRRRGPLMLDRTGARMSRHSATARIATLGRRAQLPYPVNAQMLTNTLTAVALQRGFSYRSLAAAIGVPDRRNAHRWLPLLEADQNDNASVRMAQLVLGDSDSSTGWLLHAESLLSATDLPEVAAVMFAGALLEKHLYDTCVTHQLSVPADRKQGSIAKYVHLLRGAGSMTLGQLKSAEVVAEARNNAAHGAFDLIPEGMGREAIRITRALIEAVS